MSRLGLRGVAVAAIVVGLSGVGSDRTDVVTSAYAQNAKSAPPVPMQPAQNLAPPASPNAGTSDAASAAVKHAEDAFQGSNTPPPPVVKAPIVELASAVHREDNPGPGELVRTIRRYVHWVQVCDTLLGKRQVCFLEQRVVAGDGVGLTWQVAQSVDGHVKTILRAPLGIAQDAGVKVSFGGFDHVEKSLLCEKGECAAVLPFEGRVGEWMMSEPEVVFGFVFNNRPYEFKMSLDGFRQALDAIPKAGQDPTVAAADPGDDKGKARRVAKRGAKTEGGELVPLAAPGGKGF